MTLVLAVSILAGCRTVETIAEKPDETAARETIVMMLPEPPAVPSLPSLRWSYKDGLYGLSEEDVDKFLDFRDNVLPAFVFDYEAWIQEVKVVLNKLI